MLQFLTVIFWFLPLSDSEFTQQNCSEIITAKRINFVTFDQPEDDKNKCECYLEIKISQNTTVEIYKNHLRMGTLAFDSWGYLKTKEDSKYVYVEINSSTLSLRPTSVSELLTSFELVKSITFTVDLKDLNGKPIA